MNDQINTVSMITQRLENALSPHHLIVKDESDQHIGHAGHQAGGRHFAIEISAACLQHLSRVAAHRKIYALFSDLIPHPIHALRIQVVASPIR